MEEKREEHYKKLLEEKKAIEISSLEEKNSIVSEMNTIQETGELSNYDNHPADIASELFQQEHNLGLKAMYSDHLERIETALEKVEKGDFGKCERCDAKIDEERLEVVPETKLCINCAKERDDQIKTSQDALRKRSPGDNEVLTPFGTKFVANALNVQQRESDALMDVLEFGTSSYGDED